MIPYLSDRDIERFNKGLFKRSKLDSLTINFMILSGFLCIGVYGCVSSEVQSETVLLDFALSSEQELDQLMQSEQDQGLADQGLADQDLMVIDKPDFDSVDSGIEIEDMELTPDRSSFPIEWTFYTGNPVLIPNQASESQGLDNVYAPHILRYQNKWWMWYGGQGRDGKDAIFLAWSDDLLFWEKHGGDNPIPVVDHGNSNHVNDPSVVRVNGQFYMYYTEAPIAEEDEVHLATSADGINWEKRGVVIDVGATNSWEPDRVGRPSVIYENGEFRMWYDGQIFQVARHVGYATSNDGFQWTKSPNNPVLLNEGAIDVARVGNEYIMLTESRNGTKYYRSSNRIDWVIGGNLIGLSGQNYDQFGQVTPHLLVDVGEAVALFYGGASNDCWCKNRVAVAFAGLVSPVSCETCLQGYNTCGEACQAAGASGGVCSSPVSTDPSECCQCVDAIGCENCLQGFDTCEEACQNLGFNSGVCGAPGSTNPDVCCACQ